MHEDSPETTSDTTQEPLPSDVDSGGTEPSGVIVVPSSKPPKTRDPG